jgi:hypothetical protein
MQIKTANEGTASQDPQKGAAPSRPGTVGDRMTSRLRQNGVALVSAAAGVWTMVYLGLYGFAWTDYDIEVTPSYDALTAGHVGRFLQLAPAYGGSLELRAPFALLPGLWGGGEFAVYQLVALPCLIAAALLGVWLCSQMRTHGATRLARGTALGLCAANPITVRACELGHPEELLGAVLCVAAVLAAQRGRVTWAGILLGVAIVNKQWALLAVGPVLLAIPTRRWYVLGLAGAISVIGYAPLAIAQLTSHGGASVLSPAGTSTIFQPWQLWWFLGATGHIVYGGSGLIHVGYRTPPAWLTSAVHPVIIALSLPLSLLAWRRGRSGGHTDALLLLVGLLLMRCVLDPWDNEYYLLPVLISLLAWESLAFKRPPICALLATLAVWIVFQQIPAHANPDMQAAAFLLVALPALAVLAFAIFRAPTPSLRARDRSGRRPEPITVELMAGQ